MTYREMLAYARSKLNPVRLGKYDSTGFVAAVLEGANGKYYAGVNIDLACGLGFCAERSAAAAMVTDGERTVRRIVCVDENGAPLPPCGACREFLLQLSAENAEAEFLAAESPQKIVRLGDLMPLPWYEPGREGETF